MEMSSPLAAMRPPPRPSWGFRRDLPNSRAQHAASSSFGGNNFNFRDLSMMKRSNSDYFTLQPAAAPMRGSSPTASLAADLSQNFHIDQSPQLPTPRRSLFTSNIFTPHINRGASTPPGAWEGATTPPIPSSSPGFGGDSMDISPLPHKPAYGFANAIQTQSFNLIIAPDEEMISPSDTISNPLLEVPRVPERKRSSLFRPSLSRTKCHSTTAVAQQSKPAQLPAFNFGAGGNGLMHSTSFANIDECFKESPPQHRNPFDSSVIAPPRPRPFYPNANVVSRATGSPVGAQPRRAVTNTTRPRKQFRRSLSMFESPGDVMRPDRTEHIPSDLHSIMDVEEMVGHKLPVIEAQDEDSSCSLPRIESKTLIDVLNGEYDHLYDHKLVIDCRFEYEYEGGHITGARNFNDKEQMAQELFSSPPSASTLIIFHCEYSKHRAPLMATYIRNQDRTVNTANYPRLTYPEVYILNGGYSSFFQEYRQRCYPMNYVLMDDKAHEHACERGLNKIKQRAKLSRAQTFAFGQSCQMEDSPSRSPSAGGMTMGGDLAGPRLLSRRMASY
ncbi:Rhodanese-like protein [Tothia fuscella]|uniref:M-phase inducer phosphatase n=1 Tax=Tothia fuscella TaxID=1048955 RepID=A0A9P4NHN6_9PEZI|nr:Rhodanese-like protein [Tothia fuscella]